MTPASLTDPWRGLFSAATPLERVEGFGRIHPDLPEYEDGDITLADLHPVIAMGFEIDFRPMDHVFTKEELDSGADDYFARLLNLDPPPPPGWALAAVIDTEDGPQAWFVRPLACYYQEQQQEVPQTDAKDWKAYADSKVPLPTRLGYVHQATAAAYRALKNATGTIARIDSYDHPTRQMKADKWDALGLQEQATVVLNRLLRYPR